MEDSLMWNDLLVLNDDVTIIFWKNESIRPRAVVGTVDSLIVWNNRVSVKSIEEDGTTTYHQVDLNSTHIFLYKWTSFESDPICECGSQYTSFPKYHSKWCPLDKKED